MSVPVSIDYLCNDSSVIVGCKHFTMSYGSEITDDQLRAQVLELIEVYQDLALKHDGLPDRLKERLDDDFFLPSVIAFRKTSDDDWITIEKTA